MNIGGITGVKADTVDSNGEPDMRYSCLHKVIPTDRSPLHWIQPSKLVTGSATGKNIPAVLRPGPRRVLAGRQSAGPRFRRALGVAEQVRRSRL